MDIFTFHINKSRVAHDIERFLLRDKNHSNTHIYTLKNTRIQLIINDTSLQQAARAVAGLFLFPFKNNNLSKKRYTISISYIKREEISLIKRLKDYAYHPWESNDKDTIIFYHCRSARGIYLLSLINVPEGKSWFFLSPRLRHVSRVRQQSIVETFIFITLSEMGYFPLHAALVAYSGHNGVLFIGQSGCGKTTLASGLSSTGLKRITDDMCLLYKDNGRINSTFCFAQDTMNISLQQETIPKVVIFPEICFIKRSKLIPITSFEAFIKLINPLPIYIISDRDMISSYFSLLRHLVLQCKTYILRSGIDIKKDPTVIYNIIRKGSEVKSEK